MKLLTTRPVDATSSGFLDRDSAVEFSTWIFSLPISAPQAECRPISLYSQDSDISTAIPFKTIWMDK